MSGVPVITGIGLVTPLGNSARETWDALIARRHVRDHARTMLDGTSPDRIHRLASTAAAEALREAQWRDRIVESNRTALVVGTSKGAIETWMTAPPHMSSATYVSAGAQCSAACGLADLAARLRAKFALLDGPAITLSSACASGLHALIRAAMMIRGGEADRVLVVAAEASVHPLFLASFKRLGVLPREGIGCRPFDEDRDGFVMSEAAAAVCLESAAESDRTPPPYVRIERFALGGDATHMTGGDPDGSTLRKLLARVVNERSVEMIHAHGTGTTFNDAIELAAFDELCAGDSPPSVYSHKGALGHSLGAAGLVSAALSCMMHAKRMVLPNVQTTKPLPTRRVRIHQDAKAQATRRSIVVAAGFGGPTAVISLVAG